MSRMLEIVTPEHVAIRYELAGFGARGVAAFVDMLLVFAIGLGLSVAFMTVCTLLGYTWDDVMAMFESQNAQLLLTAVSMSLYWLYYTIFEALWEGQTPGKRWLGLRAIREGGYPIDFRAVLIRNLVRAVDMLPVGYAAAFIAVLANPQYKRLGDMAAGTVVVRHKRGRRTQQTFGFGDAQVFRLLDGSTLSALGGMTRHEYDMVRRFLDRRRKLPPMLRVRFAYQLAAPLMAKFKYHAPTLGMDLERWLEEVELGYRYRTIGAPTQQAAPAATAIRPVAAVASAQTAAPLDGRKW